MAVVQDIYNDAPAKGFPGQVRNGETSNRISRTVEDNAGLAFGAPAFQGAGDHGCTGTPSAAFLGWNIANHGVQSTLGVVGASATAVGPDIVGRYGTAGLLTLGEIGVIGGVAFTKRDKVYVTPAGVVTNAAGGGANFDTGFTADETTTGAGLVFVVRR